MNKSFKAALGLLLALGLIVWVGVRTSVPTQDNNGVRENARPVIALKAGSIPNGLGSAGRHVLSSVAKVQEAASQLQFIARVDTGARVCSLHTSETTVLDGSADIFENVGKTLRIRLVNRQGESQWIERRIAEVRLIRTSEGEEARYLVPMKLICIGVEREVLVSLNDRSRMTYTMLLGRNYLDGQFVVDVTGSDDVPGLLLSRR